MTEPESEADDEPTTDELHCGVSWCGGVPTHPTGNCTQHQDREPNTAGVWGRMNDGVDGEGA